MEEGNSLRDQMKDEMVQFLIGWKDGTGNKALILSDEIQELVPDMVDTIFTILGIPEEYQDNNCEYECHQIKKWYEVRLFSGQIYR